MQAVVDTVLLDRDGVINHDRPDYVKSWQEVRFIHGSLQALALLHRAGLRVVVITNQSAVGRGLVPAAVLDDMHRRFKEQARKAGGCIEQIFFCPHRPDQGCGCRKPRPGLIHQAVSACGIEPERAIMIGDSAKDVLAGKAAGCRLTALVRTGRWRRALEELDAAGCRPDRIFDDLLAAARWLTRP